MIGDPFLSFRECGGRLPSLIVLRNSGGNITLIFLALGISCLAVAESALRYSQEHFPKYDHWAYWHHYFSKSEFRVLENTLHPPYGFVYSYTRSNQFVLGGIRISSGRRIRFSKPSRDGIRPSTHNSQSANSLCSAAVVKLDIHWRRILMDSLKTLICCHNGERFKLAPTVSSRPAFRITGKTCLNPLLRQPLYHQMVTQNQIAT